MQFACRDMGMDCDFVATGSTVDEVKAKAMAHAQAATNAISFLYM